MHARRPMLYVVENGAAHARPAFPARALTSSSRHAMTQAMEHDGRWPVAVCMTAIVGLSLTLWSGIGAVALFLIHH